MIFRSSSGDRGQWSGLLLSRLGNRQQANQGKACCSHQEEDQILAEARKEAETMFKEKLLEIKDEQLQIRTVQENELRKKRDEISKAERSAKDREATSRLKQRSMRRKVGKLRSWFSQTIRRKTV